MKRRSLLALLALSCSYDFDRYAAPASDPGAEGGYGGAPASGGSAGTAGAAGASGVGKGGSSSAGKGGSSGEAGEGGSAGVDDGGAAGAADSGEGGSTGGATTAGTSGTAGMAGAAGTAGTAGGGNFDCSALSGNTWNDHCYFSVGSGEGLAFSAAAASCAATDGAHLVTITSADEQTAIEAAFFPSATDFWIGLSLPDAPEDVPFGCAIFPEACPFEWITAEELEFTAWALRAGDDEPNYTGACVRIQAADSAWADFGCTSLLPAICER